MIYQPTQRKDQKMKIEETCQCGAIFEVNAQSTVDSKQAHERFLKAHSKCRLSKHDLAFEAIGWAYADCCVTLDKGGDPRKTDMADVILRAREDLFGYQGDSTKIDISEK